MYESRDFTQRTVTATTVGALKEELGWSNVKINVNGVSAADDAQLTDGSFIAAVKTNEKGGK